MSPLLAVRLYLKMAGGHPKIWKWLQPFAVGLMLLGAFAPLSDPLAPILVVSGSVILLICSRAINREERRERKVEEPA